MKVGDKVRVIETGETGVIYHIRAPEDEYDAIGAIVSYDQGDMFRSGEGLSPCDANCHYHSLRSLARV